MIYYLPPPIPDVIDGCVHFVCGNPLEDGATDRQSKQMHYLRLLYTLVLIMQIVTCIDGVMRWFNFKKEDKDDKDDCEPEIVTIRKTKVLPIAVPVYNRKRTYSVKTRKARKKHHDDDDDDDKKSNDGEDDEKSDEAEDRSDDQKEASKSDHSSSEHKQQSNSRTGDSLNERADTANEKQKKDDALDDQDHLDADYSGHADSDYETDELIRNAIDDDDDDIEELISNDDL